MGVAADATQVRGERGAGMSLSFSPLQQRCLDALGYTRYALVGADADAPVIDQAPAARDSNSSPARPRVANPAPAATIASALTQEARDSHLFVAVLRAARVPVATVVDPHAWLRARGVDSIASLRGDPAGKRALWSILRRERRPP